jgi:hypothetical protein
MFVETKRDGEVQTQEPSLRGFISWLETKNPNEEYYWASGKSCAAGQYAASLGIHQEFLDRTDGGKNHGIWSLLSMAAYPREEKSLTGTFGAALEGARKMLNHA